MARAAVRLGTAHIAARRPWLLACIASLACVACAALGIASATVAPAPGTSLISAGTAHTCAVKTDGTPVCWGDNSDGEATIPSGTGKVSQISAGDFQTCAIKTDGTPVCWGEQGPETQIPTGIGTVSQISAGGGHSCAVKTDGTPVCWGYNGEGQATIPSGTGKVSQIDAGDSHTCAVKTDGTPVCWGSNDQGQATIPSDIGTVSQISAGGILSCAVETDGTPVCWGYSGDGATTWSGVGTVSQVSAGHYHSCAVKTDGTPVCRGGGMNNYGQVTIPSGIGTVSQISAGAFHTCAVKTDGKPVCWGNNNQRQTTIPAPAVALTAPSNGAATNDSSPAFSGTGGTAVGDATVTIRIWSGSSVGSGDPDYTVSATRDSSTGAYSTSGPYTKLSDSSSQSTLPEGTYTAEAFQSDSSLGTAGQSSAHTFTIETAAPTSSATAPSTTGASSIEVDYTASDNSGGSGLGSVDLYAKGPTDNAYAKVATDSSPATTGRHFTYAAGKGDGSYAFYTRATDKAGNSEDAPASADATTRLDTAKPTSTATAPATTSSSSIEVGYTADATGSALDHVDLYAKGPTDSSYAKIDTDSSPAATGRHFTYTATEGDGSYAFYTVAYDTAGNSEDAPASADATTKLDTAKPTSTATAPATTSSSSIEVGYTADATGSALDHVDLYAKGPTDSSYAKIDTDSSPAATGRHFTYTATEGDGSYAFYTRSTDTAGNSEDAPASADATTKLDTAKPTSTATAPATTSSSSIEVDYTASDNSGGSGLDKVELYVKAPGDGSYSKASTDSSPSTSGGRFDYTPGSGDGDYAFYTVAYDTAGNSEDAPASADATTKLDTAKPTSTATAPATTSSSSIEVAYTADATGSALDHVDLYAKGPTDSSYAKIDTDSSPAATGRHFTYTATEGDGSYAFYTRATDTAGNSEDAPASADATTKLDTVRPSTTDDVPASHVNHDVTVTLTATDDVGGSGVDKTYYETGTNPSDPTGSSSVYVPANRPVLHDGERIKYFSTDKAGNSEAVRTSAAAHVDTGVPNSSASAPATSTSSSIRVDYTASDNSGGSGLDKVDLYVKGPADSSYAKVGTDSSASGGHFDYAAGSGDGDYAFYTIAYDKAGNVEPAPASADATTSLSTHLGPPATPASPAAPTITITAPTDGAPLVEGARVRAAYSCADSGGPAIASCSGPVPSGARIDTDSVGMHTFTVTATDMAGGRTSTTVRYEVLSAGTIKVTAKPKLFSHHGKLWVDTGLTAACPKLGPSCGGWQISQFAHEPLNRSAVTRARASRDSIQLTGNTTRKLTFPLGARRSRILQRSGTIHLWARVKLGRGTNRFAHARRLLTLTLEP